MVISIETNVSLELESCFVCGVTFGLPKQFMRNRRDDKETWYCPSGHGQVYTGKPVRDQLSETERINLRLRQELDQAEADATRKGKQLTSLRRRIKAGVCPCCRRNFANVTRHIANKHPDFATSPSGRKAID